MIKAPSSTANLGPGFDVFGLAIDAFHDEITLTKTKSGITIITDDKIPTDPKNNTAGLVVKNMKKRFNIKSGIEIKIKKGVPAGFGMGSSAASAAAAAVAFDKLFTLRLDSNSIVEFAGSGEKASAGSIHYDNVAASILGGFVIVKTNPLDIIRIEPPTNLRMCIAVPNIDVPKKKTKVSRGVIPKKIKLTDSILNLSNASAIVAWSFYGISFMIIAMGTGYVINAFDSIMAVMGANAIGNMPITIGGSGLAEFGIVAYLHNLNPFNLEIPEGSLAWDAVIGWRIATYYVPIGITWLLLVKLALSKIPKNTSDSTDKNTL